MEKDIHANINHKKVAILFSDRADFTVRSSLYYKQLKYETIIMTMTINFKILIKWENSLKNTTYQSHRR